MEELKALSAKRVADLIPCHYGPKEAEAFPTQVLTSVLPYLSAAGLLNLEPLHAKRGISTVNTWRKHVDAVFGCIAKGQLDDYEHANQANVFKESLCTDLQFYMSRHLATTLNYLVHTNTRKGCVNKTRTVNSNLEAVQISESNTYDGSVGASTLQGSEAPAGNHEPLAEEATTDKRKQALPRDPKPCFYTRLDLVHSFLIKQGSSMEPVSSPHSSNMEDCLHYAKYAYTFMLLSVRLVKLLTKNWKLVEVLAENVNHLVIKNKGASDKVYPELKQLVQYMISEGCLDYIEINHFELLSQNNVDELILCCAGLSPITEGNQSSLKQKISNRFAGKLSSRKDADSDQVSEQGSNCLSQMDCEEESSSSETSSFKGSEGDLYNEGSEGDLYNEGSEDDLCNEGSEDDLYNEGSEDDLYNEGSEGGLYNEGSEDDLYNEAVAPVSHTPKPEEKYLRHGRGVKKFCLYSCGQFDVNSVLNEAILLWEDLEQLAVIYVMKFGNDLSYHGFSGNADFERFLKSAYRNPHCPPLHMTLRKIVSDGRLTHLVLHELDVPVEPLLFQRAQKDMKPLKYLSISRYNVEEKLLLSDIDKIPVQLNGEYCGAEKVYYSDERMELLDRLYRDGLPEVLKEQCVQMAKWDTALKMLTWNYTSVDPRYDQSHLHHPLVNAVMDKNQLTSFACVNPTGVGTGVVMSGSTFIQFLEKTPNLTKLLLEDVLCQDMFNTRYDDVITAISKSNLTELSFRNSCIGDVILNVIFEVLEKQMPNVKLTSIDLRHNELSFDGIKEFAENLQKLQTKFGRSSVILKTLKLNEEFENFEQLEALANAFPPSIVSERVQCGIVLRSSDLCKEYVAQM